MKLDVKSRTSTGVEFTAGGVSNQETGKVHWVLIRSGGLPNQTNPFFLFRAPVAPISADPVPAVVGEKNYFFVEIFFPFLLLLPHLRGGSGSSKKGVWLQKPRSLG